MKQLTIGFTPDPDDAFAYYALVTRKIPLPVRDVQFLTEPIDRLNRRAARGELDIAAISSVFYPFISDDYAVLRSGASVGRGYGPALASRKSVSLDRVGAMTVAVPGDTTTGAALLRLFYPGVATVVLPHDEIRDALAGGRVEAGVLIHEELLNYPERDLRRLECLGARWSSETGLPLPVGLNVVHRRLGFRRCAELETAVRDSIVYALNHREEATTWARRFGRRSSPKVALDFIDMFANSDTVHFPGDCERGLEELFRRLYAARLSPRVPLVRFVEPASRATSRSSASSSHASSLF